MSDRFVVGVPIKDVDVGVRREPVVDAAAISGVEELFEPDGTQAVSTNTRQVRNEIRFIWILYRGALTKWLVN